MSRDSAYLLDILQAAELAMSYTATISREIFANDIQCQDAVMRRLEVVGEAARRISEETRNAFAHLPWQQMIRLRNLLIHQYDDVDVDIIWDTVQDDLPALVDQIRQILPKHQ
jgi:uncharacterized protein with HEPN domain